MIDLTFEGWTGGKEATPIVVRIVTEGEDVVGAYLWAKDWLLAGPS